MAGMRSLKPRSTYMEWLIDLLKYITLLANVDAHSLDIIIDMCILGSVKMGTNPGTNLNMLALH